MERERSKSEQRYVHVVRIVPIYRGASKEAAEREGACLLIACAYVVRLF